MAKLTHIQWSIERDCKKTQKKGGYVGMQGSKLERERERERENAREGAAAARMIQISISSFCY